MKGTILHTAVLACCLLAHTGLRADEASHRSAVEGLIAALDLEKTHVTGIEEMLRAREAMTPAIAVFREPVRAFFNKYMGWETVKDEMVQLYMQTFSEDEAKELAAFCQSPLGKKFVSAAPALNARVMKSAQMRIQTHLPELKSAMDEAAAKSGAKPPSN